MREANFKLFGREDLHVTRDEFYLITRALSIACAVYNADALALRNAGQDEESIACSKTAIEMRTLATKLEDR
jgi:hypothetical protein